jgi:hypothetical protein
MKEKFKIVEMQVLHHELKINILKPMIPITGGYKLSIQIISS